jgi:hypothetical protein
VRQTDHGIEDEAGRDQDEPDGEHHSHAVHSFPLPTGLIGFGRLWGSHKPLFSTGFMAFPPIQWGIRMFLIQKVENSGTLPGACQRNQ